MFDLSHLIEISLHAEKSASSNLSRRRPGVTRPFYTGNSHSVESGTDETVRTETHGLRNQ